MPFRWTEVNDMNIGEPVRIVEVEPLWMPLPDAVPAPAEPAPEPRPAREPAVPSR
jgi:hypothetical protein